MTDAQKALLAATFALLVGLCTGAAGYVYRDAFDAPRMRLDLMQYEISRQQCAITPNVLYLFRTAHALRNRIEEAFPWSLEEDLRDDELEYKRMEDLLRFLPQRRKYLEKELPFADQQLKQFVDFLAAPTAEKQSQVKSAIAYIAGIGQEGSKGTDGRMKLYEEFDRNAIEYAKVLSSRLAGWKRSLEQESELIPPLVKEIESCYRSGKPPALKFVGNNMDEMPNITFSMFISNRGRTAGNMSHSVAFEATGSNPYKINLIGQNPRFKTPTSRTSWTGVAANESNSYAYTIDKVRNEPDMVRKFYADLTGEKGITGNFLVRDISGKGYELAVAEAGPTN